MTDERGLADAADAVNDDRALIALEDAVTNLTILAPPAVKAVTQLGQRQIETEINLRRFNCGRDFGLCRLQAIAVRREQHGSERVCLQIVVITQEQRAPCQTCLTLLTLYRCRVNRFNRHF